MAAVTQVGRVMVPVRDQDAAIDFYTSKLDFKLTADVPYGEGDRWVEVEPSGGGAAVALVPPQGQSQPGKMTGVAFSSHDARAAREELQQKGVDVDEELMGGEGGVPLMFFMRDLDGNHFLVVQSQD